MMNIILKLLLILNNYKKKIYSINLNKLKNKIKFIYYFIFIYYKLFK